MMVKGQQDLRSFVRTFSDNGETPDRSVPPGVPLYTEDDLRDDKRVVSADLLGAAPFYIRGRDRSGPILAHPLASHARAK